MYINKNTQQRKKFINNTKNILRHSITMNLLSQLTISISISEKLSLKNRRKIELGLLSIVVFVILEKYSF